MAELIRLKRRKENTDNSKEVVLQEGEPFYNIEQKHLYIGNGDNEAVDTNKKHIAEITPCSPDENPYTVKFQIGEDTDNTFEQTIPETYLAADEDVLSEGDDIPDIPGEDKNHTIQFTITDNKNKKTYTKTIPQLTWKVFNSTSGSEE